MKAGLGQQPHGDPQSVVTAPRLLLGSDLRASTLKAGTPKLLNCACRAGWGVLPWRRGLLWGHAAPLPRPRCPDFPLAQVPLGVVVPPCGDSVTHSGLSFRASRPSAGGQLAPCCTIWILQWACCTVEGLAVGSDGGPLGSPSSPCDQPEFLELKEGRCGAWGRPGLGVGVGGWGGPGSRTGWLGVQVCTRGARCWDGPVGHTSGLDVHTVLPRGPARPGLSPMAPCRAARPLGVCLWSCPPRSRSSAGWAGLRAGTTLPVCWQGRSSPAPCQLPRQLGSESHGFLQALSDTPDSVHRAGEQAVS